MWKNRAKSHKDTMMAIRDECQSYNSLGPLAFEKKYDEKLSYTLTMKFKSDKVMVIVS